MQKTIYQCDQCKKELGTVKHIHMDTRSNVRIGIAAPQKNSPVWGLHFKLPQAIFHFCNSVCIGRFFGELMKKKI